jgi:CBS domain-containing protein
MAWSDPPSPDASAASGARLTERTKAYMHGIAEDVAGFMTRIGWRLDPHGVTASGTFAASSIGEWRSSIERWLSNPTDERVLIATSILLDGRTVYGPDLGAEVKTALLEGDRPTLMRWMLRLALASKPPTGFRRDIVVQESGEHRGTFDVKHGGLLPIVNVARYGAFKAGAQTTSTPKRLSASMDAGTLPGAEAMTLKEAWDLFAELRLEHQVEQIEAGKEPDDHLDPKQLNALTRRYLRDAFRAVAGVQKNLAGEFRRR